MKKVLITATAFMAVAIMSGCVSAGAWTETTNPDGSVTKAKASVWGTGDKASQVLAEGLYSDGTQEDLGAGFKKATATQESTGVAQTVVAWTQFMKEAKSPVTPSDPIAVRQMSLAPGDTCPTCGHCDDCAPPTK